MAHLLYDKLTLSDLHLERSDIHFIDNAKDTMRAFSDINKQKFIGFDMENGSRVGPYLGRIELL